MYSGLKSVNAPINGTPTVIEEDRDILYLSKKGEDILKIPKPCIMHVAESNAAIRPKALTSILFSEILKCPLFSQKISMHLGH